MFVILGGSTFENGQAIYVDSAMQLYIKFIFFFSLVRPPLLFEKKGKSLENFIFALFVFHIKFFTGHWPFQWPGLGTVGPVLQRAYRQH